MVRTVASQRQGPGFCSQLGHCVWSLHILLVPAWISSGCSGLLQQSQRCAVRWIGHAKLSLCVPQQAPECGDSGIFTVISCSVNVRLPVNNKVHYFTLQGERERERETGERDSGRETCERDRGSQTWERNRGKDGVRERGRVTGARDRRLTQGRETAVDSQV